MKQLIFLMIFSSILLIACRKETPLELPIGFEEVASTCNNGVMDADEDGIDCGGTCNSCILSHPIMCSGEFTDNQMSVTGAITNFQSSQITSSTASGKLVIEATTGTKTLRITFMSETPEVFRSYACIQDPTPDSESVYVQYIAPGYPNHEAYSSEVHLNRENGKYTVELCDVYLNGSISSYVIINTRLLSSN